MSNFWLRVDEELEYLGKNRAFLATKCGFSLTNINLGIKRGSTPSAETAVKIADILEVSVEYLVTGKNSAGIKNLETEEIQLKLYRKYHSLIAKCENLPPQKIDLLAKVADGFVPQTML